MVDIQRLENESDDELIYRVCDMKDELGSWEDVKIILNDLLGNDYGESSYRKKYQIFKKMFGANVEKLGLDDSYAKKLAIKEESLRKERIKLQTANLERNRIDRAEARQELYYEYIGQYVRPLSEPAHYSAFDSGNREESDIRMNYVQCISDIHYGADFISQNNEYNTDVAKERFDVLLEETIEFVQKNKVKKLYVLELGDSIQGLIHLNDIGLNSTPVVKSIVDVSRLLATYLNDLSAFVDIEYYHVPTANHTQLRAVGLKPNERPQEDFEYVISNYVKDLLSANSHIKVNMANDGAEYIEINLGYDNIVALHGHNIKGDISAWADKISGFTGTQYDYVIAGHYHASSETVTGENSVSDREVLIAPSFVGSDPYSDSLMKGSKGAVKIFGFDEVYGHTETKKIILI